MHASGCLRAAGERCITLQQARASCQRLTGARQREEGVAGGHMAAQRRLILAELALRLGGPRGLQLTMPPVKLRSDSFFKSELQPPCIFG